MPHTIEGFRHAEEVYTHFNVWPARDVEMIYACRFEGRVFAVFEERGRLFYAEGEFWEPVMVDMKWFLANPFIPEMAKKCVVEVYGDFDQED